MSNKKKALPKNAAKAKSDINKAKRFRLAGFAIAVCVVLGGLAIAGAVTSNSITSGPRPGFYQDGQKRMKDVDPFVTVGGLQVTYNEYRYHYLMVKATITTKFGGEDYWIDDPQGLKAAAVKAGTENRLREWYGLLQYAKEKGIGLTEDESAKVDNELFTVKEQQGAEYATWLKERHITDDDTYKLVRIQMLLMDKAKSAMMEQLKASDTAGAWEKGVITLEQIKIVVEATDEEEAWEQAKELAERIANEIKYAPGWGKEGTFQRLKKEYNADLDQPEGGYTMGPGKNDDIYNAAKELEVGEVSKPVKSAYGYHIVLRRELDDEALQSNKTEIQNLYYTILLNAEVDKRMSALVITGGKYYGEVRIATIK